MDPFRRLQDLIKEKGKLAVAFSGGADSTLLSLASVRALGDAAAGFMLVNQAIPDREVEDAKKVAREIGLNLHMIGTNILEMKDVLKNEPDRCGSCRYQSMPLVIKKAAEMGFDIVADGANLDDLSDHRPGHTASSELGIWHPLIEAGIRKRDVRKILRENGISVHDKPSTPCLATRIPTGQEITLEKLEMAGNAEAALKGFGFRDIRARIFETADGKNICILEVDEPSKALEIWQDIIAAIPGIRLYLDPEGYRSGSMNRKPGP